MTLVSGKEIVQKALTGNYAVGHFNLNGLDWLVAYLQVAQKLQAPIFIATSDRIVDKLGGFQFIHDQVLLHLKYLGIDVPVALHLDHGQSIERAMEAVNAGYTSVMYDGSKLPLDTNVENVTKLVKYARNRGVSVEAEIGAIGGNEDGQISGIRYASVQDALKMRETGIDYLAAGLGSVHGDYIGEPELNFERMHEIRDETGLPLVLHGASGIPDEQIQEAIANGTCKININTEANYAWMNKIRDELNSPKAGHEPVPILEKGRLAIGQIVSQKLHLFKSTNRV